MSSDPLWTGRGPSQQRFESILSQAPFTGLKAILERLSVDREGLYAGTLEADTYEKLLARLGYKLVVTRQIHVQDCYTRMGREGGIKAVLPYHDIPTQSSLPTILNFDASVTTTPKAAAFFDALLHKLKEQLHAKTPTSN